MYEFLTGKLFQKEPSKAVIDVGGLGFQLFIPLSTYSSLPDSGTIVTLQTYLHVREDLLQLFGFLSKDEKEMFLYLLTVSGIGPKLALSVVSHLKFDEFKDGLASDDETLFHRIPGVGKKLASRILLELKEKVKDWGISFVSKSPMGITMNKKLEDVVLALISLGYKKSESEQALQKVYSKDKDSMEVEQLVRSALQELSKK